MFFLYQQLKERLLNLTIALILATNFHSLIEEIFIIYIDSFSEVSQSLQDFLILCVDWSILESYILQSKDKKAVISLLLIHRIYNGISNLFEFSYISNEKNELKGCHNFDYPVYPILWV